MPAKNLYYSKRRSPARPSHRPPTIIALVLALPLAFSLLIHLASSAPAPIQSQPPPLSKEYIYAGPRLIATESCHSISPSCNSFTSVGAEASINVTAASNCSWAAISNVTWIEITSSANGSGNGTINYLVRDNPSAAGRQGAIIVSDITVNIFQSGAVSNCQYSISPVNATLGQGGGTGSVSVTATAGCSWRAVSNDSWISVSSGGCGLNNGSVAYGVGVNATGSTRTGSITIGGQLFAIKQTAN
ncbi:MAG TPA: BACON domain-containing protein [Blastocatellia bacterium]|nr:BACON domain-containing protein [Blastocatellia bacterium]